MKLLVLQNATVKQIPDILALDLLCFDGIWSKEGYKREIESPNSSMLLLFLREINSEEKLLGIGCLWSIMSEAHITLLGINPDYQRQGLGELLLYALLQDALGRKLERATLEVRTGNYPAIALYKKFGFKVAGRRKNYYPKTGEDAFILWRSDLDKPEFTAELEDWKQNIAQKLTSQYTLLPENLKPN
ncbi:MAG: ribosomal protein S18-alanine N-acetyltransferase [Xenococcaceae cyanobacterium MO_207.B15]|nr:ribosomal protein S18-alanine N-acetyltransferase [Xenococcaceae cyanobacterium MO_207.B15]MDJ0744764.1 ribosomal protein S18-alanine N-acetyltransferase [Xenococcaceae cyanobacterium MO_167.B27]